MHTNNNNTLRPKSFLSKISGILGISDDSVHTTSTISHNTSTGQDNYDGISMCVVVPPPPPLPRPLHLPPHPHTRHHKRLSTKQQQQLQQQTIIEQFSIHVYFENWEGDVVVNGKTKISEIFEKVKESNSVLDPTVFAMYTDTGVLLAYKDSVHASKLNKKSVLVIKARPKMSTLMAFLNSFFSKRVTKEELIVRKIIPSTNNVACPNVEMFRKCIDYMTVNEAYKMEGIFRVSASALQLQNFYPSLESGEPNFAVVEGVHTVPASVKQYLRSFPFGMIGPPLSVEMCAVFADGDRDGGIPAKLAQLVQKIPKENIQILIMLLEFLQKVIANQDVSLMSEQNCAIVFGPGLISFYGVEGDMLRQSHSQVKLVYIFIANYEQIFGNVKSVGFNKTGSEGFKK